MLRIKKIQIFIIIFFIYIFMAINKLIKLYNKLLTK